MAIEIFSAMEINLNGGHLFQTFLCLALNLPGEIDGGQIRLISLLNMTI